MDAGSFQTAHWLNVTLYSIGDAVIATDVQSRVTFMNPVAETLTGWKMAEALGIPLDAVFNIINEETRKKTESPVTKAMREGVAVGLTNHTLLIAKDGTERPIDDSAAPIKDDSGLVAGVVLIFRDISERKQHEQALQDTLNYADNIIATLREPFLVLGKELAVVTANAAFYQTFRVPKEQTEGRFIYDLGNGQWNIPRLRTLLEELLPRNHQFNDFEVKHDFPAIGQKIMLLNARRIRRPGNHSELILLAIEDVTDRRLAERRVRESEVRFRRLFESAQDGILLLDADTMAITDANPYMCELLGYSPEQFKGKQLWEIGLFKDKQESQAAVRTLRETGYVRFEDMPLKDGHGEIHEVEFICNVYQEEDRSVAQCNIRDITERKRLERQIEEQGKALVDAGRLKDEFLAMLSHELRNPLAPIFTALQLIEQEGGENQLQREARGIIDRQVRHMSRLVDGLLEVARITTGRVHLRTERVEINGIIVRAVERTRPMIDQRGQQLSISLSDQALWLDADSARLEQVFGNLLNNASKFNSDGGRITLSVERVGENAVIRVRDGGEGMTPQLLPHIFELFTQGDRSLDRAQGGMGLGLALVKGLVELHHGTVEVRSDGIGHGSEFIVTLPAASGVGARREPIASPLAAATLKPLRILVVDDNVDATKMSGMLLRSWGHDVQTMHDGASALQHIDEYRPDMVLLDIGLPDMDGYEVARLIRLKPELQEVRVVAVTGYGQASDRQRSKDAGFDDHLVKPVEIVALKELLANCESSQILAISR